jgi:hypothetical protein
MDTKPLMRRRAAQLIAALLLASPASMDAQLAASTHVAVGAPLRIVMRSGQSENAMYIGQSPTQLQLRYNCGDGCDRVFTTSWSDLSLVEVRVQGRHSTQRAIVGGLIGGAATWAVLVGAAEVLARSGATNCRWDRGSCGSMAMAVALPALVVTGTTIGATIGWRHQRESWERVADAVKQRLSHWSPPRA